MNEWCSAYFVREKKAMPTKPVKYTYVVSQSDFDELVRENVDEWDMEEEEAIASATTALESQGGDCSACVKKIGGLVAIGRCDGSELCGNRGGGGG